MPHLLDGGGVGPGAGVGSPGTKALTGPQSTSYKAATNIPAANRTSSQQQIVDDGDAARAAVAAAWNATQAALAVDITDFITEMQLELQRAIRKATSRGKTLNEQALSEMFAVVTYRVGLAIRLLFETKQLVGGGPGSGYGTIQDEGSSLTARTILDFQGAGVTATDSGAKTIVTIPGGSGGYSTVEDEGTPLTARSSMNFVGAGVTVTDTGSKTQVSIPGGGSTGGTGTATIDFGAFPGSNVAFVDVAATGVISTSTINAWIRPVVTADHTAEDHVAAPIRVIGQYLADDSIRVYGINTNDVIPPLDNVPLRGGSSKQSGVDRQRSPMLVGQYSVFWSWV